MTTFWPNTNAHIHAHLWSTASSLSVGLWNGGPYVSEPLLPVAHRPHNQQISCTSPSASSHRWQVKITHTIAVRRPQLSTYNFQMRPATYYYYYHSQRAPVFSVLFRTTGSSVVLALHNTFLVHRFFCNSYTHTHNCLTALCLELPGWAGTRRDLYPLTFTPLRKKDSVTHSTTTTT